MRTFLAFMVCLIGVGVLIGGAMLPLIGIGLALFDDTLVAMETVSEVSLSMLLIRSSLLGLIASGIALMLGLAPGLMLGESRGKAWVFFFGILLAPLFIPPQIYAYAWDLLGGAIPASRVGRWICVVRAGAITGAWLWPIAALIVAGGWRSVGRPVAGLARLDASTANAIVRASLPAMMPWLAAAASVIFAVAVLEYAIPLMSYARVHATELTELVNQLAPRPEVVRVGSGGLLLAAVPAGLAAWILWRTSTWQQPSSESDAPLTNPWLARSLTAVIWAGTVAVPVGLMLREVRDDAWGRGFVLFGEQWRVSLMTAGLAGGMMIALATAIVLWPRARHGSRLYWLGAPFGLTAIMPPSLLAIGSVVVWNGWLDGRLMNWIMEHANWFEPSYRGLVEGMYKDSPMVVALALVGRYGGVGLLGVALMTARLGRETVEQARCDGAGVWSLLGRVLVPMSAWPLIASGVMVVLLSMGDIVLTDDVLAPLGYNMLAPTLVGYMHYGRDEVVITTSVIMVVGGVLSAQLCAWMLAFGKAGRG